MSDKATRLTLRIDLANGVRLGPGKVSLLAGIAEHGSIRAAGGAMGMSYRRAWLLVEEMNRALIEPAVVTAKGGANGGGAGLTTVGKTVVTQYRAMEAAARTATAGEIAVLTGLLAP